jgi:nucleoside-diphosphate-sugar epimerase
VKHSFTYTPDAGRSLALLADTKDAWNQTWHVPTAPDPPTGKAFIGLAANEFRTQPKYRVINWPMLKLAGWFDTAKRELSEMLYQYEFDYVFDSTKFTSRFQFRPASYDGGTQKVAQD